MEEENHVKKQTSSNICVSVATDRDLELRSKLTKDVLIKKTSRERAAYTKALAIRDLDFRQMRCLIAISWQPPTWQRLVIDIIVSHSKTT